MLSFLQAASQRGADVSSTAPKTASQVGQAHPNRNILSRPPASAAKAQGAAAFRSGNYVQAEAYFAKALALGGRDPHFLHANRSAALAAAGRHAEALSAADEALAVEGSCHGFVKGHYRRAVALAGMRDWTAAERACVASLDAPDATDRAAVMDLQGMCREEREREVSQPTGGGDRGRPRPPPARLPPPGEYT